MLAVSSSIPEPGALNDLTRLMVQAGERRGGIAAVLLGIALLVLGVFSFGSAMGIGFLVVGMVVIGAALRGRREA